MQFFEKALILATSCADITQQACVLNITAELKIALVITMLPICLRLKPKECLAWLETCTRKKFHFQARKLTSAEKDSWHYTYGLLNLAKIDVMIWTAGPDICRTLETAKELSRQLSYNPGWEMSLADLVLRERNTLDGEAIFEQFLKFSWGSDDGSISRHTIKSQQRLDLYRALQLLRDVFISQGDEDTANILFIVALEGFRSMDVTHSRASCMLRLGEILRGRGEAEEAVNNWTDARPLFEKSLQANDEAEVDHRLFSVRQQMLEPHENSMEQLSKLAVPNTALHIPRDDHLQLEVEDQVLDGDTQAYIYLVPV
ncbi:hypothetical protein DFH09DRAFT_1082672 [Mycena vulgaris]|nr:hypothetical protein DFH09DRAFT_1082672 [Mycena vulgaris]